MSAQVTCRHCGYHIPAKHAEGHSAICPRCLQVAAPSEQPFVAGGVMEPFANYFRELLGSAEGLGKAALVAACLSFPVLCVPFLGYMSLLASGLGFGLGMAGLWRAARGAEADHAARDRARGLVWHQQRRFAFPLAGAIVCAVAFVLTVLPLLR